VNLLPLFLIGCSSGDGQILASWEGVYETRRMSHDQSICEEGPDVDADPPFFEIDTAVGDEAHLVAIRACDNASQCLGVSWFEGIVVDPSPTKLVGDLADYSFADIEGSCLVQWVGLKLTRMGESATRVEVEIEVHSDMTSTDDEQACVDFMAEKPSDGDCDDFFVLEGKRVP